MNDDFQRKSFVRPIENRFDGYLEKIVSDIRSGLVISRPELSLILRIVADYRGGSCPPDILHQAADVIRHDVSTGKKSLDALDRSLIDKEISRSYSLAIAAGFSRCEHVQKEIGKLHGVSSHRVKKVGLCNELMELWVDEQWSDWELFFISALLEQDVDITHEEADVISEARKTYEKRLRATRS